MKIKQMAEEIRQQMPKDLDELEILRYIYIYVGKQKSFDPKYYFGNEDARKKIYRLNMQNLRNEEYLVHTKNLLCTSISSTLVYLGKEFGIDIDMLKEEENRNAHTYNIARLKDGRNIHLDLQQDLKFIHTGQKTESFGTQDYLCTKLDDSTLEKIDEKIGYKKTDKGYSKDIIVNLAKTLKNKSELERLEGLLNNEEFNQLLKEDGYTELEKFMSDSLLTIGAINTSLITCYRDVNINGEKLPERQYSMCILSGENEEKNCNIYMFKKKERKFLKISEIQMNRLMEQGLKLQSNSNIYGIKKLKTILNNKKDLPEK